ncbi:MAG: hypothetical protein N3A66_09060, partial [Planctomycetota bacterium]|nr:hypothetical protein [Planctomycetota bacterium]
IVGVEHLLRPFELERVTLPALRDPILSGITVRDVAMESSETIFPWAGDKYMADDSFTWIVDLEDVAPFAEFPNAKAGDRQAARQQVANWPRNAVNGFTSADAWKLIHYLPVQNPKVKMTLPRPETITEFSIALNTHYAIAGAVKLYFDADPTPLVFKTQLHGERQDFAIDPPRQAREILVELTDFDKPGAVTTGIDNLWLKAQRDEAWRKKVKPLLNIGGLVKYQIGQGGVILNQLRLNATESVPVNAQKKRTIAASLLRNLGAMFSGGKIIATSNLKFKPIALDDQCNQYLAKDRGWLEGNRDLAHLPVGEQTFCGIKYLIRDFRTSPLPACVMLAGPGAKGNLPQEVKGLKISAKADVLFFLHTWHRAAEWRPQKPGEEPPAVFQYVVRYADGQTATIPILYGEGVGHWIQAKPVGLKSAAVAWAARFPAEASEEEAVVYQFQWNNPRPDVEIAAIDFAYGPAGNRYGTPALLAITAGVEAK